MRVLVTGADGYIGAVLVPYLSERGHLVTGLDTGFYRDRPFFDEPRLAPAGDRKDIRRITDSDLGAQDAVVHLAELSNDPLGQLNPALTFRINHLGGVALARRCKQLGIPRFVYTSSCSVYGVADGNGYRTEASETNPQTAYAQCKVLVERDVSALADECFSPTFLRNATVYGLSPRMRFDLVLNDLCGLAWTTGQIRLVSDGTPWRPLVHILDVCHAIACALEAPRDAIHNQVFNVGATAENYRVREIAQIVAESFPGCELVVGANGSDNRSYRVAFDRIHERLPGFRCAYRARDGAEQLRDLFGRIDLTAELFGYRAFTRLRQLQHLIETRQVDAELFWRAAA